MTTLITGQAAPAFTLQADDGREVSLSSLLGKKVVLYFYPKDDTSGCTLEALNFSALRPDFAAAGTEIVGVSPDDLDSHAKFKTKHGIDLVLAADPEKSAITSYGVWAEKSMYGRKYMGVRRTTVLIDAEGRIARVWDDVKVPGHAEEVLRAANALG